VKNAEFADLVRSLERDAAQDEAAFRVRAVRWAMGGYGFVAGLIVLCVGGFAACLWLMATWRHAFNVIGKVALALVVLTWSILKSLWVRFDRTEGLDLDLASTPKLSEVVLSIAQALRAPRLHRVIVTMDFNAAVSQRPRLGPLGRYENTLILGLPLLDLLSPEEFRAVLAHEVGHVSRSHGRQGAWIYRLYSTYEALVAHFEKSRGLLDPLFRRFFAWWWPRFQAHAIVVRRRHELEADAAAAERASAADLIRALSKLAVSGARMDRVFWPSLTGANRVATTPPGDLVNRMRDAVRCTNLERGDARAFEEAWNTTTALADSHPSLSERARALNVDRSSVDVTHAAHTSAAAFYLGARRDEFARLLSERWREGVEPHWAERHGRLNEQMERAAGLDAAFAANGLGVDELIERGSLAEALETPATAGEWFARALEREPKQALASFHLGRVMIAEGRAEGVAHLETAAADPELRSVALSIARSFLDKQGRGREAAAVEKELWQASDEDEAASRERAGVLESDSFEPHGLPREVVTEWRGALERYPEVQEAWLVRKVVQHRVDQPVFITVVRIRVPWYRETNAIVRRVVAALAGASFPRGCWILPLNSQSKALGRKLTIPEARLLPPS
jgi:Zn-dependent protease with chaperone function